MVLSTSLEYKDVGINSFLIQLIENINRKRFLLTHYPIFRFDDRAISHKSFTDSCKILYFKRLPWFLRNIFVFASRARKYDIVHINYSMKANSFYRGLLYHLVSLITARKLVLFIHGWEDSFFNEVIRGRFTNKVFKLTLQNSDEIIVLSQRNKQRILDIFPGGSVSQVTTMVDSELYRNTKRVGSEKNILFCGRIDRKKGVFELLNAMVLLYCEYPDLRLVYMGDGEELELLKERIRELRLEGNVKCIGYKSGKEKLEIYQRSGILVLPSYTEGFPTVVCEAMAAGLALVVTPVGGLADFVKVGMHGFVIGSMPPDRYEIALYIRQLIDNPRLFTEISDANMKEARRNFDLEVTCERIAHIYEKATS